LAWWANIIGSPKNPTAWTGPVVGPDLLRWHPWPQPQREFVLNALFGDPATPFETARPAVRTGSPPPNGSAGFPLGLNVLRYNIGGSPPDDQEQSAGCQDFRPGGRIPSPVQGNNAPVDLTADARQVDIL